MKELLISNWEGVDTAAFYIDQLIEHPLVFSKENDLWIANSYAICKLLFLSEDAQIPQPVLPEGSRPNKQVLLLIHKLARLNNGENHTEATFSAMLLFEKISKIDAAEVLKWLIAGTGSTPVIEWVSAVGKKLPATLIAKGLGFNDAETAWMVGNLDRLAKIMSPQKTAQDIHNLNEVVPQFFSIAAGQCQLDELALRLGQTSRGQTHAVATDLLICNLIGLLIQSYDAGRGLLINCVLQIAQPEQENLNPQTEIDYLKRIVVEVLRLDPPVHNTRRVAIANITVGQQTIKAGQQVMIVMAGANLDDSVFENPAQFDAYRNNNDAHLTFGLGGHACLAKYLMIDIAVETCRYLLQNYKLDIPDQVFEFEPQKNVRLLKKLVVTLNSL